MAIFTKIELPIAFSYSTVSDKDELSLRFYELSIRHDMTVKEGEVEVQLCLVLLGLVALDRSRKLLLPPHRVFCKPTPFTACQKRRKP
jgi:hypothetical protein